MTAKIKKIFFLLSIIIFIFFTGSFYFSEENIKQTSKSRAHYLVKQNNKLLNLPLLKNDTNNIIEYTDDVENYKKNKKKYKFFDLIKD